MIGLERHHRKESLDVLRKKFGTMRVLNAEDFVRDYTSSALGTQDMTKVQAKNMRAQRLNPIKDVL